MDTEKERNIFNILNEKNKNSISLITTTANPLWFKKTDMDQLLNIEHNKLKFNNYLCLIKDYFDLTYNDISYYSNFKESIIKDVFSGRRNANRDLVIGLCYAFKLNIIESNLLLKTRGYNELYSRKKRDLIILKCLADEKNIHETNDILEKYSYKTIGNLAGDLEPSTSPIQE